MDRATSEDKVTLRVRVLVNVSSLACIVISFIYVLVSVMPLWYFNGYVKGYYSLLDYLLYYSHSGQLVFMPHTDYVKHASITFTILSTCLLALSLLSLLLSRRRPHASTGLVFGVANGLGVLYGMLIGYLYRAASYDLGRFTYLMGRPNNEVVYRTLAGTITFEGVKVETTPIHKLVFESPLLMIALIVALATSTAAALTSLTSIYRSTPTRGAEDLTTKLKYGSACLAIVLLSLTALASTFTYYPSLIALSPQPPPATFEPPPYNYTCVGLTRTSRGALNYTDFETYPLPGWTSYGGEWGLASGGGFKGNALRGRDNNGGVGRVSSQYYWNSRVDGYSSLWVSVRVRAEVSAQDGWKGIGLMNADRNRLYEISVYNGNADIYKWDGDWTRLNRTSIPNYVATSWYTLVLFYRDTGTAIEFSFWVYNATGHLVAYSTARDIGLTRFRPAYVGVTIDASTTYWFRFEDFVVSTADPRSISFTGFYVGMMVEVWDNLGSLVNSTTAPATSFYLNVTSDIVVGTGVDGRMVVKCPDGYVCGVLSVPTTDAILGGDAYALSTRSITWTLGANKTSANVTVYISSSSTFNTTTRFLRLNASQTLYARLLLEGISIPTTFNLDIWVEGAVRSTNITIRNGVPLLTSTNIIQLNLGFNNSLALSGHFTAVGQPTTLQLKLELYAAPGGMGVCVRYPLNVMILGGSSTSQASTSLSTYEPLIEQVGELGGEPNASIEEPVNYGGDDRAFEEVSNADSDFPHVGLVDLLFPQ